MSDTRKGLVWPMRKSRRIPYRALALAVSGCVMLAAAAGCPTSASNPFEAFIPSESDLLAFNLEVENLPSAGVRIVNETTAAARVEFTAGFAPFADPFFLGSFPGEESFLQMVDSATILVAQGGTVTGEIKCGEVIGVAVTSPSERESLSHGENRFGLFIGGGNVELSGVGSAGEEGFTGDLVSTARFVHIVDDEFDCETETLVIRIETTGTNAVYDEATGALMIGASFGTGSLTVE